MRILVACEESQRVTVEMRKAGHEAYSCDLLPSSGMHPEWHIQADCLEVAKAGWDAVIAFPPCTHLTASGAAWFDGKRADGRQYLGMGFFLQIASLPVRFLAIENPVGIMSNVYRKPDQIIQPWMFGEPYTKSTCLWLRGFPPLEPTDVLERPEDGWENEHMTDGRYSGFGSTFGLRNGDGTWRRYGDTEVKKERSKTFPGVARAMGVQWGGFLSQVEQDGFTGMLDLGGDA